MKHVLVLTSSNRLMEHQTTVAVQELVNRGAGHIEQRDTGDVSLARNLALSMACQALQNGPHEAVLMIDDDMVFTPEQAEALVTHALSREVAASACYVLSDGRLAATHLSGDRWLTGLGFLAIPRSLLLAVASRATRFRAHRGSKDWVVEFTRSCADLVMDGEPHWDPEDYRFTRQLGGCELLPIAVGHVKKRVLLPDHTKLSAFIAEEQGKTRT
jgi:hypothetical protein